VFPLLHFSFWFKIRHLWVPVATVAELAGSSNRRLPAVLIR
jgi:hypothetical protein